MIVERISSEKQARVSRLNTLEKQYGRAGYRIWWWLSIPFLWISGWLVTNWLNRDSIWELYGLWCVLVLILIGLYIYRLLPSREKVIHDYSQTVLPELFSELGATDVRVARRHDLSMKTFLESGLYHDKYNAISREDSIQGKLRGEMFGMYEVAMQIRSARMSGRTAITSSLSTNHFYGWFIVVNTPEIPGFHFVTMRIRKHAGESDDWHRKSLEHWSKDTQLQKIFSGNPQFDQQFMLNSDQPHALISLLNPAMQEFLLYLAHTTKNSFAISIQKSRVFFMIGHENAAFRRCPQENFAEDCPAELREDVKWFVELISGLSRLRIR